MSDFVSSSLKACRFGLAAALLVPTALASAALPVSGLAQEAAERPVSVPTVQSRVDLVQGRAVLVGKATGAKTLRRGDTMRVSGTAQLEIGAGSQARLSLGSDMTVEVFGPSSVEWSAGTDGGMTVAFHELAWADVETRGGVHHISLPADWRASFGRTAFQLRSIAGGPTELRNHAGGAVSLEWWGSTSELRPPLSVYPGSSVRLDRPRFGPKETPLEARAQSTGTAQAGGGTGGWATDDARSWPWRSQADTEAQIHERQFIDSQTDTLTELPGAPGGTVGRVRAFRSDGSSRVRPIRRTRVGETSAQIPVAPSQAPRVEFEIRSQPAGPPVTALGGPKPLGRDKTPSEVTSVAKDVLAAPKDVQDDAASKTFAFEASQWRGLARPTLNGTGHIAAERGTGVEVRVLGGGRTKVFVSAGSPVPRWCFTPTTDYLLSPGAVAVFEKDGSLRMSFGDIQESTPLAGRPSFGDLQK